MKIVLHEPGRSSILRDYFARLGATASVRGDRVVEVEFPHGVLGEDESVETHLQRWSAANRVGAEVVVEQPARPALAAVPGAQVIDLGVARDGFTAPVKRIGDLLVSKGLISKEQLAGALAESRETGDLLGRVLLRRSLVFEEELARTLAEQWGLPWVSLYRLGVDARAARLLPPDVGKRYAAIPVRFIDGVPQVAFADPSDPEALEAVAEYVPDMTAAVSELSDIDSAWRKLVSGAA